MSSVVRLGDQVVVFRVGRCTYATAIGNVREIEPAAEVTWVPDPPPGCEGVINLRGGLVPVFNLRGRLGLPAAEARLSDHFLFVRGEGRLVAFRVDSVSEVAIVSEVVSPPSQQVTGRPDLLEGAVKVAEELVPVIDLARLVDPAEYRRLEEQSPEVAQE
ncbi:MAG: chemotaxis protein CheW [Planctomycetota bacterium]